MGSPYLLAHGTGIPVKDAETTIQFPESNEYYSWVRTKNWVPGNWETRVDQARCGIFREPKKVTM